MFRVPIPELQQMALEIRQKLVRLIWQAHSGHLDTCLSLVELYLGIVSWDKFKFDPKNGSWDGRTPLFLSEGHACPLQYLVNAQLGYYPEEEVWDGFRHPQTPFQGHTARDLSRGLENSNGLLGIGLGQAYGHAMVTDESVICIAGDGEMQEPTSLDLFRLGEKFPWRNFILIVNHNELAQDARVLNLSSVVRLAQECGWRVQLISGHNFLAIGRALETTLSFAQPSLLVADTVKGKGISSIEDKLGQHGKPPSSEAEVEKFLAELHLAEN
ncbi:MAG: hypothetical protein NTZ18_00065 [Candidatus Komeilibacteria bacterium]|nr:hypothetical protein [Candidatus Komeilibacteria bacterium]